MKLEFSDFASRTDAEYALLKTRTDACADIGRSYELSGCTLPEGCVPETGTLGFCRIAGKYLLYVRPEVKYCGKSDGLAELFRPGPRSFGSFEELAEKLRELSLEADGVPKTMRGTMPGLYVRLKNELSSRVLGQEDAVEAAAFKLYGYVCKKNPARPLSMIFYGPTGVGKSELGKAIAPVLGSVMPGKAWQFHWTDMNTFTEQHSAYRLTGAPPGYVGYDDKPIFEAVRSNPNTVFMFDELEKAHPEVLKVFMSVLDEGRSMARKEDENGSRELDFRSCIFVFTTNADLTKSKELRLGFVQEEEPSSVPERPSGAGMESLARRIFTQDESARRALVRTGVLREIAGRFGGMIGFRQLDDEARIAVTAKQIKSLGKEYDIRITHIAPEIVKSLVPADAFSVRSSTGVLEGVLTQLFADYSAGGARGEARLEGTPEAMKLVSVPSDAGVFLPAF